MTIADTAPCPRCQTILPTTSRVCPNCGLDLLGRWAAPKQASQGGGISKVLIGVVVVTVVIVVALFGGALSQPTVPRAPVAPSVPWSDYSPTVRTNIDAMAAAKNCAGLQAEFNTADANNAATLARTGHNNAQLMAYIDFKMRAAGCYG